MLRRKLASPKTKYVQETQLQPALSAPTTLCARLPNFAGVVGNYLLVREKMVTGADGSRVLHMNVWPDVCLCTGDMLYTDPTLKTVSVQVTWSDFIKVMKRRVGLSFEAQAALLVVSSWIPLNTDAPPFYRGEARLV